MSDFFRFPSTPHLAWLGDTNALRDDKLLSAEQANALLSGPVVVEEKLDGANLGLSLDADGNLRAQNRGQYLSEPHIGQFSRLPAWLGQHGQALRDVLKPGLILFGEWCAARHSLDYGALPDWFLAFDVYDSANGNFWSTQQRNSLAAKAGLSIVPRVFEGHTSLSDLLRLVSETPSRYRAGQPLEGVVVRRETALVCEARAKVVRADFAQAIDEHWRSRTIEWDSVNYTPRD